DRKDLRVNSSNESGLTPFKANLRTVVFFFINLLVSIEYQKGNLKEGELGNDVLRQSLGFVTEGPRVRYPIPRRYCRDYGPGAP
ncbi:hypothetical protein AVEN_150674-2-1, partial [Araneus ventricosus]